MEHIGPGGAEAGDQRPLKEIRGNAGVLADGHQRLAVFLPRQHLGGGKPHLIGQGSVQPGVYHAADAVGTK